MKKKFFAPLGALALSICFIFSAQALEELDWGSQEIDFPHGNGITHSQYPAGLDMPSFNNYTDNEGGEGIEDERKFLVAKNITQATDEDPYTDTVTAKVGDVILVSAFINNNGKTDDIATTAIDARTGMTDFIKTGENYTSISGTEVQLQQYISASNGNPNHIWDTTTITSENGNAIKLQYGGNLSITPNAGGEFTDLSVEEFFGEEGVLIGDPSNPDEGTFRGGAINAMHTFAYFYVIEGSKVISNTVDGECQTDAQLDWVNWGIYEGACTGDVVIDTCMKIDWNKDASENVNIPNAGEYEVVGYATRGVSWGTNEAYKFEINGTTGPVSYDDNEDGQFKSRRNSSMGTFHLHAGSNTINMLRGVSPNDSVAVTRICLSKKDTIPDAPTCNINISPASVQTGESATLSWSTSNAENAIISNIGNVNLDGSRSISPSTTKTYVLTATASDGQTATCQETLTIESPPTSPPPDSNNESCKSDSELTWVNWGYHEGACTGDVVVDTCKEIDWNKDASENVNISNAGEYEVVGYATRGLSWGTNEAYKFEINGTTGPVSYDDSEDAQFKSRRNSSMGTFHLHAGSNTINVLRGVSPNDSLAVTRICLTKKGNPSFQLIKKISNDGVNYGKDINRSNGETAYYKLFISNNGNAAGDTSVSDSLGAASNGGSVGNITNASVTCASSATCTGAFENGNLNISNLEPGQSVSITYQRSVSDQGVPEGGNSSIVDTASLSQGIQDHATVHITKQAQAPSCYLNADPTSIIAGENVDLTWTTQNATEGTIDNGIGDIPLPNNSTTASPTQTTTYTMTVTGPGGQATCQTNVDVTPAETDFSVDKRVWTGTSWNDNTTLNNEGVAYYRVAVQNIGNITGEITLTDILSASSNGGSLEGITNEEIDCPVGGTCTGSLTSGGIQVTNFPVGEYLVVDYQRKAKNAGIPAGENSNIVNTAKLSNGKTNTASVTVIGEGLSPVFQVMKTVSSDAINYGESITRNNNEVASYKIVVTNVGNGAGDVTLTDGESTPTNGGSLSTFNAENIQCDANAICSGSLAGGGINLQNLDTGKSVTVTYKKTANTNGIPSGENSIITNTATLSTGVSDTANVTLRAVDVNPSYIIDKTVSNTGDSYQENVMVQNGETAYFKVVATNTGTGTGDVTITDSLLGATNGGSLGAITNEMITCATGASCNGTLTGNGVVVTNFGPNQKIIITYNRTVSNAGIPAGDTSNIVNMAKLSTGDTNEASVTIPGPSAQPLCSNFISIPPTTNPGEPITLNWNSRSQVSFSIEEHPIGEDYVIPYSENGTQTNFTISEGIFTDTEYTLTIYNGPDLTGESATCPTLVVPVNTPNFEISKLISDDGINFTNETITVNDGDDVYYAVVVQNTGSFTGTIGITDTASAGTRGGALTLNGPALMTPPGICSGGNIFDGENPLICTLQPNGTITATYSKKANNETIEPGKRSNFVNVAELLPTGQQDDAEVIVRGGEVEADLAVQISVDDDNVPPNTADQTTTLTYTVPWQNLGNIDMPNTTVTISCDADAVTNLQTDEGTVNGTNIVFDTFDTVSGESGSFTFTADLQDGFGDPADSYICSAHIESNDFLPISSEETNQMNNDDEVPVMVNPNNLDKKSKRVTNLRTEMSGTNIEASEGDQLTYTLTYKAGDQGANGFIFTDDITDILEYSDIIDAGGGNVSNGTIKWDAIDIPANTTQEVSFTIQVFDVISGGDFKMTNVYGDTVTVKLPKLVKNKYVQVNDGARGKEKTAKRNDVLTYTLAVTNTGEAAQVDYIFSDDIGDILGSADIIDLGGGEMTGNTISWPAVTIGTGETVEKMFQVQIRSSFDDMVDYELRNVFGEETIVRIPHLAEIKTVTNLRTGETGVSVEAEAGDTLNVILTVEEVGKVGTEKDYVFIDNVTDTLEYATISDISDGGVLDAATNVITWPAVDIPAGSTVDRTFTATVFAETDWPSEGDYQLDNFFGNTTTVTVGELFVDTIIEKVASVPEATPGGDITYTLTYRNIGDRSATNAVITDDYDETKIDITSLPNNCALIVIPSLDGSDTPLESIGGPAAIQCLLEDIPAHSTSSTIEYVATVLDQAEGTINNTATIGQDQVDQDLSNNTDTASVPVNNKGLTIEKTGTPDSLVNGQKASFTVSVTNNGATKKTFTVRDVLSDGNNKGSLSFINDSFSVNFVPESSGTSTGTFANNGIVQITDLEPKTKVIFTYTRIADNTTIPFNLSSQFINTATIIEDNLSATDETYVTGPTKGGGGGGGGGGRRRTSNNINLLIQKEVKDVHGKWHDADTFDLAAEIKKDAKQKVDYKIVVHNEGSSTGTNIKVEDIFTSDSLKRIKITDVDGAKWSATDQTFTIPTIRSGKSATIRYSALLSLLGEFHEIASGKNVATITDASVLKSSSSLIRSSKAVVKGVGETDPAFVKTEIADKITLQKTVQKKVIKAGDEDTFNIIVHNRGKMDYENVVVTDNFPFDFLDLVQANNLKDIDKENQKLTFSKRKLKAGDIWIIKLKVKAKNTVPGNTRVRNSVTIAADNADLSGLYAYAEIIVTPLPQPNVLISTGPFSKQLLLILLGLIALGFSGRQMLKQRRR